MADAPLPPALASLLSADLPAPLKALAGLAVTAVEDARHLPEKVSELPASVLTAIAAQSMRVQQQYADWVAKGEEFIGSLRPPQEDAPAWATFDEDLPVPAREMDDGAKASAGLGPGSAFDLQDVDELPVARRRTPVKKSSPAAKTASTTTPPAKKATPAKKAAPAAKTAPATAAPATAEVPVTPAPAVGPGTDNGAPAAPASLPNFHSLTIPQLRSRLKTLKSSEIVELIEFEERSTGRAPVVQMLRARLETLQK